MKSYSSLTLYPKMQQKSKQLLLSWGTRIYQQIYAQYFLENPSQSSNFKVFILYPPKVSLHSKDQPYLRS